MSLIGVNAVVEKSSGSIRKSFGSGSVVSAEAGTITAFRSKLEMRKIVDELAARSVMSFINVSSSKARSCERLTIAIIRCCGEVAGGI
jgi:hypothetical protein